MNALEIALFGYMVSLLHMVHHFSEFEFNIESERG